VAASLVFFRSGPDAFPIDDAYIHFAYADNLAAGRGLIFQSEAETGLGTTSALWVGLLALGRAAGMPAVAGARILGVLAMAATSALMVVLVEPSARRLGAPWAALAAGGLTALCGPLLWFALSGMETMLFAALGLAALLAYRAGRWRTLGACLGLLYLTRPEGLGLALAIGAVEVMRSRRITAHLWQPAVVAAVIMLPWLVYLYWRTGELLPSSYYGKQFSQQAAIDYFGRQVEWLAPLTRVRPIVFAALSFGYWFLYFWGGAYLPAPRLELAAEDAQFAVSPSLWTVPVAVLWLVLIVRAVVHLWRARCSSAGRERGAWLAFGLWLLLHNGAFALMLPAPGTASRYIVVDYLLMAGGVALGLATIRPEDGTTQAGRSPVRSRTFAAAIAGLVVAIVTGYTLAYWRDIYVSSARQIAEVRIPMAAEVRHVAPPHAVVAAFDIGVVGYYGQRPIADLGGLTDERFLEYADEHRIEDYLCAVGARYLVAPDSSRQSGGSYYDYLGSLGLGGNPKVKLTELASVRMDEAAWQIGGAATGNSTAVVLLYEIEPECGN
jgi:hypothetical protein